MVARRWALRPLLRVLRRARRMGLWAEMKPLMKDRLFPVKSATTNERNPSPPDLFQMTTGYWVSQAIYVAAKLGIADLLKDGPQSCVALATATGADAASLFRLMRALARVGVFFLRPHRLLCSFPPCGESSDRSSWISQGNGNHAR
jgi:hypothetical protein